MVGWKKKQPKELPRRRRAEIRQREKDDETSGAQRSIFRRNRTLVGSLSIDVSSASELDGNLQSPRAHIHHLTAHRRRLGGLLTGVFVATGLLIWLLYQFTAGILVVSSTSSVIVDDNKYQKIINNYFAYHPMERLRFMLNDTQLTSFVVGSAPEVESVRADGESGFATGQFSLTFRRPVASWLIGSTQYYVDKNGAAYQTNYFEEPQVKIIDQSGVPQVAGTALASSRFLHFVGRTVEIARTYNLTVSQAIIPPSTTRQIEIILAGHSYPIKLSLDRPVGEQVEDVQRAVSYFDSKGQSPQYIDVRVSGKAYYR